MAGSRTGSSGPRTFKSCRVTFAAGPRNKLAPIQTSLFRIAGRCRVRREDESSMSVAQLSPPVALDRDVVPCAGPVQNGKVILISYAFPPDNTSGAVRVGKFVQHLSER